MIMTAGRNDFAWRGDVSALVGIRAGGGAQVGVVQSGVGDVLRECAECHVRHVGGGRSVRGVTLGAVTAYPDAKGVPPAALSAPSVT